MKIKHSVITSIILIFPPFYSSGQEMNQLNRVTGDYSFDNTVRIDEPGMKNQYYLSKNKTTDLRFTIKGGNYSKVRIEGMNKWKSFCSGVKYLRKYKNKQIDLDTNLTEYFEVQKNLFQSIKLQLINESFLKIAFVGDIMWIRNGWTDFLDVNVKSELCKYDFVFGNLETPIDESRKIPRFFPDYPSYNSSTELLLSFYNENCEKNIFTAVSLANNHCLDRKETGLQNTLSFLEKNQILYSGISIREPNYSGYTTVNKNGIKIGFYSATWGVNNPKELAVSNLSVNIVHGIAPLDSSMIDISGILKIINTMKKDGIDFIILSLHWGYEFEFYPDQAIIKIAHQLACAGADIILGSHPHVLQPIEICPVNHFPHDSIHSELDYNLNKGLFLVDSTGIPRKVLIYYSLGNFTSAMFTPSCRIGVIQSVNLFRKSETGKVDWTAPDMKFVYNTPSDPLTKSRKLMMWDDYIEKLKSTNLHKAIKIENEIMPVIHHVAGGY
jgi:hypothetical protein